MCSGRQGSQREGGQDKKTRIWTPKGLSGGGWCAQRRGVAGLEGREAGRVMGKGVDSFGDGFWEWTHGFWEWTHGFWEWTHGWKS